MELTFLLYICIGYAFNLLMIIISNGNWLKTNKRFAIKKLLDCAVPVFSYVYLVYGHYIFLSIGLRRNLWVLAIGSLIIASIFIVFFVYELLFFSKISSKNIKGTQLGYILLSLFFTMLVAATIVNYVSYILWPAFYEIPRGLNHAQIGFEFFYYTFTLMVTYSGTSITALHVVTKAMQIIEITVFYILFGVFFIDLLAKNKSAHGLSVE